MSLIKTSELASIHNRYIPALLLVALFTIFAYINVEEIIHSIEDDAKIINTSGRQRMLSQNLILLGLKYLDNPSQQNKSILENNIKLMDTSHAQLLNSEMNAKLDSIYNERNLSVKLYAFLAKFDFFIAHPSKQQITVLSSEAQVLLSLLSQAVEEYERINHLKVDNLEKKTIIYSNYYSFSFTL